MRVTAYEVGGYALKQKTLACSVMSLTDKSRYNYDCPCGQVISYEILRIVMIGQRPSLRLFWQSYHNAWLCQAHNGEQSVP